ncbi:MAG TPA: Xaa-Pro dipeptidase [Gammaproteobacteria bacterium]|nr:Xaa-Pro dipeptidase [Gammaproteobacteria bacterium]
MNTVKTIGPAAFTGSLGPPEELVAQLASEYGAHLAILDHRLEEALAATGFDGAVIFAGDERPVFRDDLTYPFRVEPYFKAWVPLTQAPGSFLRLVPGQRPMLVYKQAEDYWHEPPRDPEGYWTQHFDIRVVRSDAEARKLSGSGPRWVAIGSAAELAHRGSPATQPAVNDARFLAHMDFTRAVKTGYELACMRAAQSIAVRGHLAVAATYGPGVTELELHHTYLAATGQREAELPYPNIIALNEHAATLHYQRLRAQPNAVNRSLLIDAGAEWNGYAADITRTYSANEDDFAALIAAMDALQQRICGEVRPGVDFMVLHALMHRQIAALLREAGITKCSADEAVATGITRAFLPHGLGHLLGLQVHDAGGRLVDAAGRKREPPASDPHLRLTRTLKPGFVVTIEPGMYFIPSLLRSLLQRHEAKVNRGIIERLLPFGGIRVEDDVEVTQDGHRNMTREAFAAAAPQNRGRK